MLPMRCMKPAWMKIEVSGVSASGTKGRPSGSRSGPNSTEGIMPKPAAITFSSPSVPDSVTSVIIVQAATMAKAT